MDLLEGIPRTLYKYRIWEDKYHKRILTDNEIYFASADSFNDPFDASIPFRYDPSEITQENLKKKRLIVGREMWPNISEFELEDRASKQYEIGEFGTDTFWKDFNEKFKKDINDIFGIFSLTSKNDNLLMWSHYANSHKGFCVGFDKFEIYNSILGTIGKVVYTDTFPFIPMFEDDGRSLVFLLRTKSNHWEYEDEYRIVKGAASRKTFSLNTNTIKEIIFGCRIDPKSRDEIIALVKSKPSNIKLYDSVIDDTEYKLNIVEIQN